MTAVSAIPTVAAGPDLLGRSLRDVRISVTDRCNFQLSLLHAEGALRSGTPLPASRRRARRQGDRPARGSVCIARGHQDPPDRWGTTAPHRPGRDHRGHRNTGRSGHRADHQRGPPPPLGGSPSRRRPAPGDSEPSFARPDGLRSDEQLEGRRERGARWHRRGSRGRSRTNQVEFVVQRGVNEDGLLDLVDFARREGFGLRCIEYMDVGATNGWRMADVVSGEEILERVARSIRCPTVRIRIRSGRPHLSVCRWRRRPGCHHLGQPALLRRLYSRASRRRRQALHMPARDRDGHRSSRTNALPAPTTTRCGASFWPKTVGEACRDDRYSELRGTRRRRGRPH